MSVYTPDSWVILKITLDDEIVYKVLAGWSGGYLDGDSWRANSGIVDTREDASSYWFHGSTGSVYVCHKNGEGVRLSMAPGLSRIEAAADALGHKVEIITAKEYLDER